MCTKIGDYLTRKKVALRKGRFFDTKKPLASGGDAGGQ